METGYHLIPHWVWGTAPVLLIAFILAGGYWLKALEKRDRERRGLPPRR